MASAVKKSILLTFDVEDWFQVENFKSYIEFSIWDSLELRVKKNTLKILELLYSFPFKPKATFFILGWIAQRLPGLVRQIHEMGHEVASHGFNHHLYKKLPQQELIEDLKSSKKILEDLTGNTVNGFRAPSFSINNTIIKYIKQTGYTYDSSFNSFSMHGRYGSIDLNKAQKINCLFRLSDNFYELPLSNLEIANITVPLGGGGYFRLYPFPLFKSGMKKVMKKDKTFIFYAHPWEFDPEQPRVKQASQGFKFRHYINLNKTETKLKKMITAFQNCNFTTCTEYIKKFSHKTAKH
ncbi:XrtA system polysaccharide deacetylase [Desulfobacula toluolica]|nr:XrtA system polysaccharide deacetylase [Desulfobacula toluolica]